MRNLIGKYNRNRKLIWFILGIIIAVYALIHIANSSLGPHELNYLKEPEQNDNYYETNYSVVSSVKIEETTNEEITKVIKDFIAFCNSGNIEEAYSLLSTDCKEVLYPTIESFKKDYYRVNFNKRKTYNLQSWIAYNNKYTYMVELIEDMLSTGTTFNTIKKDYITVLKEKDEYKLNISGFIEKNSIDISKNLDSMDVVIQSQEIFVDYLNLNINVYNKTDGNILLDSGKNGSTVYLKDLNDFTYISYLYEVNNLDLIIRNKSSKNFKIKFDKSFKGNTTITEIGFLDVNLNYDTDNKTIIKFMVEI